MTPGSLRNNGEKYHQKSVKLGTGQNKKPFLGPGLIINVNHNPVNSAASEYGIIFPIGFLCTITSL